MSLILIPLIAIAIAVGLWLALTLIAFVIVVVAVKIDWSWVPKVGELLFLAFVAVPFAVAFVIVERLPFGKRFDAVELVRALDRAIVHGDDAQKAGDHGQRC